MTRALHEGDAGGASGPAAPLPTPGGGRLSGRSRVVAIFFIQGMVGAMLMMRIPDLQLDAGLSAAALGIVLMGAPIGGLGIFLFATPLIERVGTRLTILVSFVLMALGAALSSVAETGTSLFLALLVFGAMSSIGNIAMNVEADRVEAATGARVMNRCHGMWSVGFLIASSLAGAIRGAGIAPAVHLWLCLFVFTAVTLALAVPLAEYPARAFGGGPRKVRFAWPTAAILALAAFGLGAELLEGAARVWATIYLRDAFDVPAMVESAALPAFILTMAGGRLVAARLVGRYGARRFPSASLVTAAIGLAIVVASTNAFLVIAGFAVAGLGTGVVYPLMLSSAARIGDRPAVQNVAAITLVVQIVMLISPAFVGALAETLGVRFAFACLLPLLAIGAAMSRFVR